jgi:alginate O-acetyltransferase complex protein AlgI
MVFSSSLFLIWFLPVFLITYFLVPYKYRNALALVASVIFYSWGAPKFIFVILGTTFLDFHLVKWMSGSKSKLQRRLLLTLSVSVNLGLLFYFKYSNFFVENLDAMLKVFGINGLHWSKLIMPIGISFYTFETVTYVVDVYRRVQAPLTRFWDYQLYIILFPKLIAGPIVRYHEIADQIVDRRAFETADNRFLGMFRFIIGLAKKVLIANVLGAEVDRIFALGPMNITTPTAWIGIVAYSFQIYYDFSGYSDMAIGIAKMLGFTFPENFNNPYTSRNITEFWRRWHMTLGRWMKDYLYIPLGGSRVKTKTRLFFNLWLVFLISGLWHGAAWNFIIWGGFHGLFLVLDRLFLIKFTEKIGKVPSVILTYFITLIGWVLFRATDLTQAWLYIRKMFAFEGGFPAWRFDTQFWAILLVGAFFGFFGVIKGIENWQDSQLKVPYSTRKTLAGGIIALVLLVYCMASLTTSGFNPFIYFRF